ncbi:MAG: hypothetical protein ACFE9V_20380, partial [Candidatus Hodarchaeota archaeon]
AQSVWDQVGNGTVIIRFYANDTLGNLNYTEIIVYKDIFFPIITINSPKLNDVFNSTAPNFIVSISGSNLDTRWYTVDDGLVNYTFIGLSGTINPSAWNDLPDGYQTIKFYINNTLGALGFDEITILKDTIAPSPPILINYPQGEVYLPVIFDWTDGSDPSGISMYRLIIDNESDPFTTPGFVFDINITNNGPSSSYYEYIESLQPSTYYFFLSQIDGAGLQSSATTGSFTILIDTDNPLILVNSPFNNTYIANAPVLNIFAEDPNLDSIWYRVGSNNVSLVNNVDQQLESVIWDSLLEGPFQIYIYANDTFGHLNNSFILTIYKDTDPPDAPILLDFPQGEVDLPIIFNWSDGNDPSGIIRYRLIIDTEPNNPFTTPGLVFEINITDTYYEYTGTLQPGDYYFFLYQIDGAGHQSPASSGSFSIISSSPSSQPPEFPLWIIIVIIGAAVGGVIGIVVLKKSKSKKISITQITEKKPEIKPKLEIHEELSLLDYETLKNKSHEELHAREEKLLEYIKYLEENKEYTKEAEFIGELMIIENILGNAKEEQFYRQKQIDVAVKGLEYLKDQYEIESKNAAISGDYSKALALYKESKLISDNLKIYLEGQESSDTEGAAILESVESEVLKEKVDIVYLCINDLLTKYFDEIGIKYYSNPQIYDDIQDEIHGLILTDNKLLTADIDSSIKEKIKSIQIIYTEDISNENITKLCQTFQNPFMELIIVGIKWPENIEAQTIEIPPNKGIKNQENIKIIHHKLFSTWIGLKGAYEMAFNEIIDLYNKSELDFLHETHESSEIIIHSTDELLYDLKEKGLVKHKLKEYFHR